MLMAADIIATQEIRGEANATAVNERVGSKVRETMRKEGATLPENLPVEKPIPNVRKRLAATNTPEIEAPKNGLST